MKKIGIIPKVFGLWLLFLSHLTLSYAVSGTWTTPGTPIPPGATSGVAEYVSVSFNPTNSQYMATWADSSSSHDPYYSIFDGTSWIITASINLGDQVLTNVFNAVDPITGNTMAVWIDRGSGKNTYSIYILAWDFPHPIEAMGTSTTNVFLSANTNTGDFLATWRDFGTGHPFSALFHGASWTTPAIEIDSSNPAGSVFSSFNPISGQFLATWYDATLHEIRFSIFNGSSWSAAATIPLGSSTGSIDNVFTSVNTNTGKVLATWADNVTRAPYYSIYNGTSWTPGAVIPLTGSGSSGAFETVATSFNSVAGVFLATWGDLTSSSTAYYALFDGTSWTTPSTIPGAVSTFALFSAANPGTGEFLATWKNTDTLPYYGIFTLTSPIPISIEPPAALTAKANISNQFGVVKEYYNLLKWTPSPTQGVVEYRIFRNSELIATVGANVFKYKDHNRKKHEFTVYSIVSVDASGNQSSPITISVE